MKDLMMSCLTRRTLEAVPVEAADGDDESNYPFFNLQCTQYGQSWVGVAKRIILEFLSLMRALADASNPLARSGGPH